MMKNAEVLALLASLIEGHENGKELDISHLDRELLYASRATLDILLIEAADVYHTNSTKCKAFRIPSIYRFGKQLLRKLYDLLDESDDS